MSACVTSDHSDHSKGASLRQSRRTSVDSGDGLIDPPGAGCWGPAFLFGRGRPMSIESQLREKLRKIEALFAGASTAG